ncbi:MAG TPA: hypothetical protein VMI12_05290 [Puia sp.]|nr:hypothetical protein [Puia sp.]
MKISFCFQSLIFFGFIILFNLSCTKKNTAPIVKTIPNDTAKSNHVSQDTLFLSATEWDKRADGVYASNISELVNTSNKAKGNILAIYVSLNGRQQLINSNHALFQNGELWSGYEGSSDMIFFKGPYNQIPFHYLDLEIIVVN